MSLDIRDRYQQLLDTSHSGRAVIIDEVRTGGPGRPSIYIDPDFLQWAYCMRSTASIAAFLGVSRGVVCTALLRHGISQPQESLFANA